MPDFNYTACDASGVRQTGTISAASRREAAAALAGRSLFPLTMEDVRPMSEPRRMRRVPAAQLAVTYGQLADLLRSGVPLLRALTVVEKQTSQPGLRSIMEDIRRQVEDGKTLADAMLRWEGVLGEMAVSMVRAGGEGGFLEEALTRVAQFTEGQDDLKKRTMGALAYPAFLAVVGTVIVTVLIVFFVPKFSEMFDNLRKAGQLPLVTEWLLATSDALRSWPAVLIVGALVGGGWFASRWVATDEGRWWVDTLRLRLPLLGPVFLGLAVSRFCRVLGTLLHNGVPIIRSLQISRDATGNRVLAAAIGKATETISAGQPLAGPLGASGQFPPIVVEMIAVAEQANNLETVLVQIAESQERLTWRRLDLTVRLLEPIMLLILASVILVLVIALLLPILRMSSTIG